VCLGVLMIVLDTTIVTVALPSILADLRVSGTSLTWMLNAYMLTFGGFLLLGGRLGDLYGRRRLFLAGISVFTLASLACGLAHTLTGLLIARAGQGLGGAVVAAVSLSLIMNLFSRPAERARAMGIYGFVCAAGSGVGELLGGFLTKTLSWHWVFLVNLPIGIAVYAFCIVLLPRDAPSHGPRQLDVAGAVAITTALTLVVYALVNGNEAGWTSAQTQGLLGVVALLLLLFLSIEIRVREPLMPLRLFRLRNFTTANVLGVLWAAATFAWFVISALYLQRVLGYDPFRVGFAFVPATMIMAAFSAGLSAKIVMRFGIRGPLWIGLLLAAAGLALFARAPLGGAFVVDVLPGMLLLGLGAGMASTPLLLAAMNDVNSKESGVASGIVNTSFMMGGALGLAVLASLADVRTGELQQSGIETVAALNGGYHVAFLVGALLIATAAVLGALVLRPGPPADTAQSNNSISSQASC
jgi:EmrB/QacA subfamily drug resistance transporter